jgi:putative pyruvate formate lyase activating enzyme
MRSLVRPDSLGVWEDPEVERRLSRYHAIINKAKLAKYLIAKKTVFDGALSEPTHELWSYHHDCSEDFRNLISEIDLNEIDFSKLPTPSLSYLDLKTELAHRILSGCYFCERKCGAGRTNGEHGWCKLGSESRVSSAFLHTGEEAPLVPSGTIFFSSCCLGCVFCQNDDISTNPNSGRVVSPEAVAVIAEGLHRDGALNINYVGGDPIPNTHTIVGSLVHQSSNVTQLWNSNLYCSLETMDLLSDLIDVWLPDFKYGNDKCAERLSGIENYFDVITRNHLIAYSSGEVIIRHLVMPNHLECCTIPILEWVAESMPNSIVNIMGQYRPEHRVRTESTSYSDISRRVSAEEMTLAHTKADELGICWRPVS